MNYSYMMVMSDYTGLDTFMYYPSSDQYLNMTANPDNSVY